MAKQKADTGNYDAGQIQVLEGLEPVRKRPGMYIGGTGKEGLHHLIKEIADNSIDEAIAGHASHVEVVLLEDGGLGIPFSWNGGNSNRGFSNNMGAGANYNYDTKKNKISASYFYNTTRLSLDAMNKQQTFLSNNNSFTNREVFEMEYRLRSGNGDYRWILEKGIPRYEGDDFAGYIGSCIDISEQKKFAFSGF